MTNQEFKTKAAEVIDTCSKYNFMDYKITPYAFSMTVKEFTRNWEMFDQCTDSSKSLMKSELEGFLPILDNWVKIENESKVFIRYTSGNREGEEDLVSESHAALFVEAKFAEYVD